MSKESIVQRIISDAEKEAENIISQAEARAAQAVDDASLRAERKLTGVKAEVAQKVKAILDGKAATARLDAAKAELREKRRVIDTVYKNALAALVALDKKGSLSLAERLLCEFAEEGDEILFAPNYKYSAEVSKLDVVKAKKLKISNAKADVGGGFVLKGKNSDKDVSYGALLQFDREERQAEIAAAIFKG
ncbi:MAG: hypothetical protein K2O89_07350 [Clostridia bacterium]|nr:hypothetical protein [Clostridia bacterium]